MTAEYKGTGFTADTGTHAQEPTPAASTSGQQQPAKPSPQAPPMPTAAHAASAARGIKTRIATFITQLSKRGSRSTQTALFGLHVTLIMLAMLHLQPLNRKLSRMAWIYFLQTSLVSHGFKVSLTHPINTHVLDCDMHCTLLCHVLVLLSGNTLCACKIHLIITYCLSATRTPSSFVPLHPALRNSHKHEVKSI